MPMIAASIFVVMAATNVIAKAGVALGDAAKHLTATLNYFRVVMNLGLVLSWKSLE